MGQPPLPDLTLDDATCIYGAGVLLKHVEAFEAETAGVKAGEKDIEFVHKARVASRRLRASLPLFSGCFPRKKARAWLKEIRSVTRALGEARDADVQIEALQTFALSTGDAHLKPGINRLMLRLRQKRADRQAPAAEAMRKMEKHNLVAEMRSEIEPVAARAGEVYIYTATLYQNSFNAINLRLDEFMAFEAIVEQPEKVEELHQMRIAAKWLRYTMENFAPLYSNELKPFLQAIKQVQELLGNVHDCDVWLQFLPTFRQEEQQRMVTYLGHSYPFKRFTYGLDAFQQERRQARDDQYAEFVRSWRAWQQEGIWDILRKTIQAPLAQQGEVYPPAAYPESNLENQGEPQPPAA